MNDKLINLLSDVSRLAPSAISHQSHLSRDLGLDSLDLIDLVLKMEYAFQISIPDEDYPKLQTVDQIKSYLDDSH